MFFFGHVGITVGAIHSINQKFARQGGSLIDLRKAAVLSLGPDLIDKPIGLLYRNVFENHTRLFAHHALFSVLILVLFWRQKQMLAHWMLMWCVYFGHIVLDRFWDVHGIKNFLWPLCGPLDSMNPNISARWYAALQEPYNFCGELAGIIILLVLFRKYRLYRPSQWKEFWKVGTLPPR